MTLSKDDIRSRLGLLAHVEFSSRGRGLTTEMLLDALATASEGKDVVIIAHDYGFAKHLDERVTHMAKRLDIKSTLIHCLPLSSHTRLIGTKEVIYVDHWVTDPRNNTSPGLLEWLQGEQQKHAQRIS